MSNLVIALEATIFVSLLSLVGAITLIIKEKFLKKLLILFVAFSAGSLMGGAFLHLIPEAAEESGFEFVSLIVLVGITTFFLLERVMKWHHCHKEEGECEVHTFTHMNLVGDAFHNFLDGLILFAGFAVDVNLGIATTIAVITHEIPQELGDFGVLVYGGFSKFKALLANFLVSLTSVLGVFVGFFITNSVEGFTNYLIPFAAGGFIYISASDLIPELHKEPELKKSLLSFLFFIIGIAFMFWVKMIFEH